MLTFFLILIIIAAILLIFIILAQSPKGGGLSGTFGGATQFLGVRQTADFLEKATWYFGIGIIVCVTITYFLTVTPSGTEGAKAKVSTATEGIPAPPSSAQPGPQQGGRPQQGQPQPQQGQPQPQQGQPQPQGNNPPPPPPPAPQPHK